MDMHLNQLRYVIKISQCGSISQAAKELFIAQPSLSQQILNLEEELNVKLFIRDRRKIMLTDAGREFVEGASAVLRELEQLTHNMARYSSRREGKLVVGVIWVWAYLGINAHISDFKLRFPNIDVQLLPNGSVTLYEMLMKREVDCCIIHAAQAMEAQLELYIQLLIEDYFVAAMDINHPLSHKESVSFHDICEHSIILPGKDSAARSLVLDAFSEIGITPKIACESTQSAITFQLVADGAGIAFVAKRTADIFQYKNFAAVPIEPKMKRDIYLVARSDSVGSPILNCFLEFMHNAHPI